MGFVSSLPVPRGLLHKRHLTSSQEKPPPSAHERILISQVWKLRLDEVSQTMGHGQSLNLNPGFQPPNPTFSPPPNAVRDVNGGDVYRV